MQELSISGGNALQNTVFSVGHSNHSWEYFRSMLQPYEIGVVLDVRSNPRSRLFHFNKPELRYRLNAVGISYLHMGDQLGGYPKTGSTDYEAAASTAAFSEGIIQVLEIAARCRPVLMCAEHEALECHRCLLVGRYLVEQHGVHLAHIQRDGRIEGHTDTEERLLQKWGANVSDLFQNRANQLAAAYRLQARKLGMGARV
jgi:uncharacterized protein (DUF488 family)